MKVKIIKFEHSCIYAELEKRNVLFDPGSYSIESFDINKINKLDDLIITHIHQDHINTNLIKDVISKFPDVLVSAPNEVITFLNDNNIKYKKSDAQNIKYFEAPHESVTPLWPQPEQRGIHYSDIISNPGDSHSFNETKKVLILPYTAPWGHTIKALNIAIELKPKYVIPVHDWHYKDQAKNQSYELSRTTLEKHGIEFIKIKNNEPVILDTD